MTAAIEKNPSPKNEKPSEPACGKEQPFDWSKEFLRLCRCVHQLLGHLEKDIEALPPLPSSASAKKSALADRNGLLAVTGKLIQLFSELMTLQQQLPKPAGTEEETAVTEADLEIIEHYFKKCREIGLPLLGATKGY